MIIPKISLSDFPAADVDALTEALTHWSLFGQVALVGITASEVERLEPAIKRIGGIVDLAIEMTEFDEPAAVALLNAGATFLLCRNSEQAFETIPDERIKFLIDEVEQDQAIPPSHVIATTEPTVDRIAELEMARIDCLVPIEVLNTDLITAIFKTVLISDRPDGLWSTVIVDPLGTALGLAYSNEESLHHAIENRVGAYWSRSREGLWIKGQTSGATQKLLNIRMDCDRDCLRFMVTQDPPGFCHRETHSCFGEERTIQSVMERLLSRINESDEKSFTRKLANDAAMLEAKLLEESKELSDASQQHDKLEVAWEAADVLYFSLVAMLKNGVTLDQVHQELARRMNRVVRRKNKLEEPGGSDD